MHDRPRATVLRVPLADGVAWFKACAPVQEHFEPRFTGLCGELAAYDVPETVQHDDLHHANLYAHGDCLRVLDWGDASISHPFASLVVTFRFLEERTGLAPGDPWFARLRDAYLEPRGRDVDDAFALALRVGSFARPTAYVWMRAVVPPEERLRFDTDFSIAFAPCSRPNTRLTAFASAASRGLRSELEDTSIRQGRLHRHVCRRRSVT